MLPKEFSRGELSLHGFTKEERENSHRIINDLFSYPSLPDLRDELWALILTITTGDFRKLKRRQRAD